MNQEDIKQMVGRLNTVREGMEAGIDDWPIASQIWEYKTTADMLESLSKQLADCQQTRDSYCSAAYRAQTKLAALKAEPRLERTKQLEDSIAALFDSEIPKGNALAQEMCMIGRKYRSQQDRIDKLEAALIHIQQVACSGSPELGIAKDALK